MAKMFDADASPQDAGFNALRIGISLVAEYEALAVPDSRLKWAIVDLRTTILDLVESLMTDEGSKIVKTTDELMGIVRDTFGEI